MGKPRLSKRDRAGIKKWLKLTAEHASTNCPFQLGRSHTPVMCKFEICEYWFPKCRDPYDFYIRRCPCHLYPIDYVKKVARKMLRD